jgi:hypothetical protein
MFELVQKLLEKIKLEQQNFFVKKVAEHVRQKKFLKIF